MRRSIAAILLGTAISVAPAVAAAHISITSGPGYASATQIVKFGVGHGCAGVDTYSVKVDIPGDVTSVRPLPSDFGKVSVQTDATGAVIAVLWQRAAQETLDTDIAYYELSIRLKLPEKSFRTIFFPTHQVCRAPDGALTTTEWIGTDPSSTTEEPAPAVKVVPAHQSGWNKFQVAQATTDLSGFFPDALIVWRGNAAYSPNAATADLIAATAGVGTLGSLDANEEIWVKY
jgi:periplasmic copper chaperone A